MEEVIEKEEDADSGLANENELEKKLKKLQEMKQDGLIDENEFAEIKASYVKKIYWQIKYSSRCIFYIE